MMSVFFKVSRAAYVSQCDPPNAEGKQTNCTTENNATILKQQCVPVYGAATCTTMAGYLSAMRTDCLAVKDSGVNCDLITNGGLYGSAASSFATYQETHPKTTSADGTLPPSGSADYSGAAATGNLVFPTGVGLPDPSGGVRGILVEFLKWLLLAVGLIAIIAFVIAGLQYFLAAGDETLAKTAKQNMIYSIWGVVAALSAFVIVRAVDAILNKMSF